MATVRLHQLPARASNSRWIHVVIDTPKGSRNKYKYDELLGVFRLSRMLPAGMQFPYDFGSVPRTRADDGDALDVMVIMETPTFPGCLLTARLLGALRAKQKQGRRWVRNDRLIAVAETNKNRSNLQNVQDLGASLEEIVYFFESYNRAQGRAFKLTGTFGVRGAENVLRESMRAYARATSA